MSSIEVRPFRRSDREQVTKLVNAHAGAVVPGVSVSVNSVLSQLEREPGEFIVDPWVSDRKTLVAQQRRRVVAAAHLLRYAAGEGVGESYRNAGEIRWFLFWPGAPYWPDSAEAAAALIAACVEVFVCLGRGAPVRGRRAARAWRLRRARAVAAHHVGLRAGRVHPQWAHRDRLHGHGEGSGPPGRTAPRRDVSHAVGWDQRNAPVRHARRRGGGLHRGGDARGLFSAGPAQRLGRHWQPLRRRAASPPWNRYVARWPGGRLAAPGRSGACTRLCVARARGLPCVPRRAGFQGTYPQQARMEPHAVRG